MHKQRVAHKTSIITIDNDLYFFFELVPLCYTLNVLFLLLVAMLFITQVFMKAENQSLIVQFAMVMMYLKVALLLDEFKFTAVTVICFAFFTVMSYMAWYDALSTCGVANIDFYHFKILRDENEKKIQPSGALYFIGLQAASVWAVANHFQSKEVHYIANMLIGYLLYRVWAYFEGKKGLILVSVFPFSNFSSAAILFWFTLILDASQVYNFLVSLFEPGSGLSRLDLIMLNYFEYDGVRQPNPNLYMTLVEAHKVLLVFQIAALCAVFQKYYEFKNFVELSQYKKAVAKCKETYHKNIVHYRLNLVRPGKMRDFKVLMAEGVLFQSWMLLFFIAVLFAIFG